MNEANNDEIRQALNLETAKISWEELQRYFAKGLIIKIAHEADLIDIASKIIKDDGDLVSQWLENKTISKATDEDAIHWHDTKAEFWSVVTAPWVLVQEIAE